MKQSDDSGYVYCDCLGLFLVSSYIYLITLWVSLFFTHRCNQNGASFPTLFFRKGSVVQQASWGDFQLPYGYWMPCVRGQGLWVSLWCACLWRLQGELSQRWLFRRKIGYYFHLNNPLVKSEVCAFINSFSSWSTFIESQNSSGWKGPSVPHSLQILYDFIGGGVLNIICFFYYVPDLLYFFCAFLLLLAIVQF